MKRPEKNQGNSPRLIPPLHIGGELAPWILFVIFYTVAVAAIDHWMQLPRWSTGTEAAAILGTALGILIVFRKNAANDRWWEARKLWGQLINESRNLALKAKAHADVGTEEYREFGRFLSGFPHALRLHLRGEGDIRAVPGFEEDPSTFPHAPGDVANRIHQTLNTWNREGKLRETIWILDVHARALMDVCGACERIRNTPLPASFRALLRWGIFIYLFLSPWSLALEIGWWSVPVTVMGFSFLMGMELTAEAVEEPFGRDADDLPLENYCRTINEFVQTELGGFQS